MNYLIVGGIFVSYYGTTATFRGYGIICMMVLIGFIFINFYRKDTGFVSDLPVTEDPHQVIIFILYHKNMNRHIFLLK